MNKKLSTLLGLREKLEKDYNNLIADMLQKFTNNQGIFGGFHNTYTALEGFADDDSKRGFQNVESTVQDQLDWTKKHMEDYLTTVLTIEKTNAQNITAELFVDGKSWGTYSTLELLRLKGVMDGKLGTVLDKIPVRSEKKIWNKTEKPEFAGREVWETPVDEGYNKTTRKDTVIVQDPHIHDTPGRPPITKEVSEQVNVGKYTKQEFSGGITKLERAKYIVKHNNILKGIIAALEDANNVDATPSDLGGKVLNYLFSKD